MARKLKSKNRFDLRNIIIFSGLLVIAGLLVAYVYGYSSSTNQSGSSTSEDCVVSSGESCETDDVSGGNSVTCVNGVCTTGSGSGGSDDNDSGTTTASRGGLSCTVIDHDTIRWRASWRNATGGVVLSRSGAIKHRFRRSGDRATGSGTFTENGLSPNASYRGELRHAPNGANTLLDSARCRTESTDGTGGESEGGGDTGSTGGSTGGSSGGSGGSTSPDAIDGQVVTCHNSLCTTYSKSSPNSSVSSNATTVCNGSDCQTYSAASTDGNDVAQSLNCDDDECVFEATEVKRETGIRGFFIDVYRSINSFFKNIFG